MSTTSNTAYDVQHDQHTHTLSHTHRPAASASGQVLNKHTRPKRVCVFCFPLLFYGSTKSRACAARSDCAKIPKCCASGVRQIDRLDSADVCVRVCDGAFMCDVELEVHTRYMPQQQPHQMRARARAHSLAT